MYIIHYNGLQKAKQNKKQKQKQKGSEKQSKGNPNH